MMETGLYGVVVATDCKHVRLLVWRRQEKEIVVISGF